MKELKGNEEKANSDLFTHGSQLKRVNLITVPRGLEGVRVRMNTNADIR